MASLTLVLAVAANDGVVLVADGQATAGKRFITRTPAEKLGCLYGRIAYGCAGHAGLRQRVVAGLEAGIAAEDCGEEIEFLRPKLLAVVNRVQKEAADEFVEIRYERPSTIEVLFVGVSDSGRPWIYEITEVGGDEVHPDAEAIGTGRHYARYALMSAEHYRLRERGLPQARVLAYRAVDDAIRTDAHDLGEPISVYTVTRHGARLLTDEELKDVSNAMAGWQKHEREVFQLVGEPDNGSLRRRQTGGAATGIDLPTEASSATDGGPSGRRRFQPTSSEGAELEAEGSE